MKRILGFRTQSLLSFRGPGHQSESVQSTTLPRRPKDYTAFRKIHKAASQGDAAEVQRRLILGKDGKNDRDRKNRTILHYACAHGHLDVVTLLMDRKCDIDLCDSDSSTPLIKSAQYGHEECMAILLERGAVPNAMDNCGNTALHYAVWSENISMAGKLLVHQASIDIKNKKGYSPHTLALIKGNQEMIQCLVSKGASIYAVDEPNRSPSESNSGDTSKEDESRVHIKFSSDTIEEEEKQRSNVTDESETLNQDAAGLILQGQNGKVEDQQVPAAVNQECNGTAKETPSEKNKIKDQENFMFCLDELTTPSQTKSEDSDEPDYDTVNALFDQLTMEFKGSNHQQPILYAVQLYKKSMEVQKSKYAILAAEHKDMKKLNSILQKELSETKEAKLQQELQIHQMERELHDLRVKTLYEMKKGTHEHQNGGFSVHRDLNMSQTEIDDEKNTLRKQIDDVTAQVKHASLYLECLKGKHKLVQEKLQTMANEEEEKDIEEKLLLEKKLEQEVINLKTHIKENMIDKKDAEKHLQEVLQREAKKTFKEVNRILQVLQLKTEADRLEEQRRNDSVAALRTEMEGIVREKESELAKLKSEEAFAITELEIYKERYREQLKVTFSLRQKRDNIRKSIDQLQKDNARLLVENEQFRLSHRGNFY